MKRLLVFFMFMGISLIAFTQKVDTIKDDSKKSTTSTVQDNTTDQTIQTKISDSTFAERHIADTLGKQLYYDQISNDWFLKKTLHLVDTTLQYFYQTNPNFYQSNYYQTLGNTGLASQNLFLDIDSHVGFKYQKDVFDIYNIKKETLKLYKTHPSYSKVYYKLAPSKEQIINFEIGQRVYKQLILGIDVDIINSVGSYFLQKTQNRRVAFTSDYETDNRKYALKAYYIHNKHLIRENGGIANDTIFNENIEEDRLIYTINLYNSENLVKNSEVFLKHSLELGNPLTKNMEETKHSGFNLGRAQHQFRYYRYAIHFKENYNENNRPKDFYSDFYYDDLITNDTMFYDVIENTFSWKNSDLYRTKKSLGFDVGATYQHIRFKDTLSNDHFNQFVLYGKASKSIYKDWKIGGTVEYVQGNINSNDFLISGQLQGGFSKHIKFNAYIEQIHRSPDYFYQRINTNHFIWNQNPFDKENIFRLGGVLHLPFINIEAKYSLLSNYVFLNKEIVPQQISTPFSLLQFHINPVICWNKFSWISHLYLQKPTRDDVIHLPLFAGKTTFSYGNTLFNKALFYRVGFDVRYHTNYYADYYMPALRSFYRQDDINIGNIVYGSVFVALQIKRVNILFKYRNISQGLTPYNYYGTPHYPLKDRGLEFAISWRFND